MVTGGASGSAEWEDVKGEPSPRPGEDRQPCGMTARHSGQPYQCSRSPPLCKAAVDMWRLEDRGVPFHPEGDAWRSLFPRRHRRAGRSLRWAALGARPPPAAEATPPPVQPGLPVGPLGNVGCDRRGQGPRSKTSSRYLLGHWAVLHLELCSRAAAWSHWPVGAASPTTLSFWG